MSRIYSNFIEIEYRSSDNSFKREKKLLGNEITEMIVKMIMQEMMKTVFVKCD